MAIQIIAIAAKAAAKSAAKGAAKSAAKSAGTRAAKASDAVYNARRRYARQAERYLKKAETVVGPAKSRFQAQAREATVKAAQMYAEGKSPQGMVSRLMQRQGISKEAVSALKGDVSVSDIVNRSYNALQGAQANMSRDEMAKEILSTGNIGSRFYGGLVQVWDATEATRKDPNAAILKAFGESDIMEVLESLEQEGVDIYTEDVNQEEYDRIMAQLQLYVLKNRNIKSVGLK